MKTKTATTIKIEKNLYDSFKILGIQKHITLQTFVEKCVNLYVHEGSFRDIISKYVVIPETTGSLGN